jgi:hypothetical protein
MSSDRARILLVVQHLEAIDDAYTDRSKPSKSYSIRYHYRKKSITLQVNR